MLTLMTTITLASEELQPLIAPPLVIAGSMAGIFVLLGLVTWSYRDVANRHSHKASKPTAHDAGH